MEHAKHSRVRLGHVHLKVRDLDRSVSFYTRFLGFRVTETLRDRYAFLTGSSSHHELALQQVGPDAPEPMAHGVGLYHVAFEVPDRAAFARAYRDLTESGVPVNAVDHGISWALYFTDPDGNGLEIYRDTRIESGGREVWRGESRPLTAETILSDTRR